LFVFASTSLTLIVLDLFLLICSALLHFRPPPVFLQQLFLFCAFATIFLPSGPFTGPYLLLARLGAAVFCLFQQIILIDIAYNWNEAWVERADSWDRYSYGGGGNVWLRVIVVTTVGLYISVLVGISLLYRYFSCADNMWIVTLTLLGVVAVTAVSALADGGSLLTSGVISLYVTYLAYSMVSKNPVSECNPQLGSDDVTGMVIGLTLTALSLAWTGWSFTAEETLEGNSNQRAALTTAQRDVHLETPFLDPDEARPTSGVVVDGGNGDDDDRLRNVWKLNVVMALISCWVAMTLTGWGSLEDDTHAANPTAGRFNMAMIGISQWCAILLYVWTLAAPTLFPDRDFS
jgi:serine incorporator 1/3